VTRADDTAIPDYLARLRLDGQSVLVVGAGQGNGRQSAHALSQAGASVVCVDIEADRAHDIADEVGGTACVADARTRHGVEEMVGCATLQYGRLDHVVDIVGMARYATLTDVTDDDWDWTFAMVLGHSRLLVQIAGPEIATHGGGTMTFVASVSALAGAPYHGAYGAAKAGLLSLVRTAAVELGPQGVRVNAIAPGQILTPRIIAQMEASPQPAARRPTEPLGKLGEPPDIAGAALYLATPLSSHVTGHCLVVDGGVTANFAYPIGAPPDG
jgi:3-oxoacyl-[acyl-carrier protein] reductase